MSYFVKNLNMGLRESTFAGQPKNLFEAIDLLGMLRICIYLCLVNRTWESKYLACSVLYRIPGQPKERAGSRYYEFCHE
jgi:hypothetical protein